MNTRWLSTMTLGMAALSALPLPVHAGPISRLLRGNTSGAVSRVATYQNVQNQYVQTAYASPESAVVAAPTVAATAVVAQVPADADFRRDAINQTIKLPGPLLNDQERDANIIDLRNQTAAQDISRLRTSPAAPTGPPLEGAPSRPAAPVPSKSTPPVPTK